MPNPGDSIKYTPHMPLANVNWVNGQPLPGVILGIQEGASGPEGSAVTIGTTLWLRVLDRDGVVHEFQDVPLQTADAAIPATGHVAVLG